MRLQRRDYVVFTEIFIDILIICMNGRFCFNLGKLIYGHYLILILYIYILSAIYIRQFHSHLVHILDYECER
jgi:hypothetical protein